MQIPASLRSHENLDCRTQVHEAHLGVRNDCTESELLSPLGSMLVNRISETMTRIAGTFKKYEDEWFGLVSSPQVLRNPRSNKWTTGSSARTFEQFT